LKGGELKMSEREIANKMSRREFLQSVAEVGACGGLFVYGTVDDVLISMKERGVRDKAIADTEAQGYPKADRKLLNLSQHLQEDGCIRFGSGDADKIVGELKQLEIKMHHAKIEQEKDKLFQLEYNKNLEARDNERPSTLRHVGAVSSLIVGLGGGFISFLRFVRRQVRANDPFENNQ